MLFFAGVLGNCWLIARTVVKSSGTLHCTETICIFRNKNYFVLLQVIYNLQSCEIVTDEERIESDKLKYCAINITWFLLKRTEVFLFISNILRTFRKFSHYLKTLLEEL